MCSLKWKEAGVKRKKIYYEENMETYSDLKIQMKNCTTKNNKHRRQNKIKK
jgi:hypothetical protein